MPNDFVDPFAAPAAFVDPFAAPAKTQTPEQRFSIAQWQSEPDLSRLQPGDPGSFASRAGMPTPPADPKSFAEGADFKDPFIDKFRGGPAPKGLSQSQRFVQWARDFQRKYRADPGKTLRDDIAPEVAAAADLVGPWGVVGMAVGGVTGALGYGFGLDQGLSRKESAKQALGFAGEMAQGPLIPGTNVHLLTPATDIVKLFSKNEEPTTVEQTMGMLTQGIAMGGDAIEKISGGAVSSEETQLVAQAVMARLGMKGYGWDGKTPAPAPVRAKLEEGARSMLEQYAAKADEPSAPSTDRARFSTLRKAGMVDALGAPMFPKEKAKVVQILDEGGKAFKQSGKVDKNVLIALGIGGAAAAIAVPIIQDYYAGKKTREETIKRIEEMGRTDPRDDGQSQHYQFPPSDNRATPPLEWRAKDPDKASPLQDVLTPRNIGLAGLALPALMMMDPRTPLKDIHPQLDYSTKVLSDLNDTMGKRAEFTREQVLQRANKPTVGKFEREMYADIMKDRPTITAAGLVAEVKKRTGDFELKPKERETYATYGLENIDRNAKVSPDEYFSGQTEGVDLTEFTAPPSRTTIYQSPIELGNANHFQDPNYFAHARSFDEGGVRHVVEVQSDLAQKEKKTALTQEERWAHEEANIRAQRDLDLIGNSPTKGLHISDPSWAEKAIPHFESLPENARRIITAYVARELSFVNNALYDGTGNTFYPRGEAALKRGLVSEDPFTRERTRRAFNGAKADLVERLQLKIDESRAKLKMGEAHEQITPMLKNWERRIVREEVAEAMRAGQDRIRFATADTVAKVEGWPRDMAGSFRPEHQGIYDRYRREIETYLRNQHGAKPYTDEKGHTWLEVELPKPREGKIAPTQMFGGADYKLLLTLGLSATAAAYAYKQEGTIEAAIAAGAAGLLVRKMPEYLKYVASDWKNALYDTAGVAIVGAVVGGGTGMALTAASNAVTGRNKPIGEFNPVAAAIVSLALTGRRFLSKNVVPKINGLSIDELTNIRSGELARKERTYTNLRKAFEAAVPDLPRREVIWEEAQKPNPAGLSPAEMKVARAWQGFAKDMAKELSDVDLLKDFVENYVTRAAQRTNAPPATIKAALAEIFEIRPNGSFAVSSKFMNKRTGVSIAELELALAKKGLRLDKDIASVVETYGRSVGRAIENKKFVEALKGNVTVGGQPGVLPLGKAPLNYVPVRAPSLQGKLVHPDLAPYLKLVMEARTNNELVNAALALSMAQKRLAVGFSLFHAFNLGVAHLGSRGLIGAAKDFGQEFRQHFLGGPQGPISAAREMFVKGGLGDQLDWGLREGLKVDPMADVDLDAISHIGRLADATIQRTTGIATEAFGKGLGKLEAIQKNWFDRFTWDYMHFGMKNSLFIREFERALSKEGFPDWSKAPDAVKSNVARQVAAYVNDVYGHLDWNRVAQESTSQLGRKIANMALSPNGRVLAQILMFAPDWTLSTFRAMYKALPGKTDAPINKRLHTLYAMRTGFFMMTVVNAWNLYTAGHPIWENKDPLRLEFRDGTSMQLFKHASEFGEWVMHPKQTLVNKMGYLPSEIISQISGQEFPGSKLPMQESPLAHALERASPFPAKPFLDPSKTPADAAKKAALGLLGAQTYGHTAEEKERLNAERRKKREEREYDKLLKGY